MLLDKSFKIQTCLPKPPLQTFFEVDEPFPSGLVLVLCSSLSPHIYLTYIYKASFENRLSYRISLNALHKPGIPDLQDATEICSLHKVETFLFFVL